MGFILKGIGTIIGIFILLAFIGAIFGSHDTSTPSESSDTKTAYTRDGNNFVSKERVEENIKYGYAKEGDYKEVQVPLDTVVVGASTIKGETSKQEQKATQQQQEKTSSQQTQSSDPNEIRIKYSGQLVDKLGYLEPGPGKVYLVVKIDIENHGYSGVDTNPYKFTVEANNIEYDISGATYMGLSDAGYAMLDSVTLKDGGKTSGYLAYEVPKGTSEYSLTYSHWFENVKYN